MENVLDKPVPMRIALGAVIALVLSFAGWRAYTSAVAAYWAEYIPERAFEVRPGYPRAEFARAEEGIRSGKPARYFVAR